MIHWVPELQFARGRFHDLDICLCKALFLNKAKTPGQVPFLALNQRQQ